MLRLQTVTQSTEVGMAPRTGPKLTQGGWTLVSYTDWCLTSGCCGEEAQLLTCTISGEGLGHAQLVFCLSGVRKLRPLFLSVNLEDTPASNTSFLSRYLPPQACSVALAFPICFCCLSKVKSLMEFTLASNLLCK